MLVCTLPARLRGLVSLLILVLGLAGCSSTGNNPVKEIFIDPFSPARSGSSPGKPAASGRTPRPVPAPRSNTKAAAFYIPFGLVEGYARSTAEVEYTKLKRHGGALGARNPQVAMVNRIVEDLKVAIRKYSRLSDGAFVLEPVNFSSWEVNVFHSKAINANVMPGGKITVYDGILHLARDDEDAVAVILGHEIAHELLKHSRNRAVTDIGYTAILAVAERNSSWARDPDKMRSLGTAINIGGFLPWSRSNESEADHLGAILAAIAGYDITRGEWLWKQMSAASKGEAPPEWLSTHPSGQARVNFFSTQAPLIQKKYGKYHGIPLGGIK